MSFFWMGFTLGFMFGGSAGIIIWALWEIYKVNKKFKYATHRL